MKRIMLLLVITTSTFFASQVHAQKEGKTFSFGFGLEGGVVTGKFNADNGYNAVGGITLRASYKVGPGYATLTSGALIYLPKKISDDNAEDLKVGVQIPVKAGYKFIFAKHLFVQGEVGYSSFKVGHAGDDDEVITESYGGFTYAPTIGANFGAFEIGLRYETVTNINSENLSTAAVRLGFNF